MTKRAREKLLIWSVSFTSFVDDYKLRGSDPSTTKGPYLFRKEADAYKKLYALMRAKLAGLDVPEDGMDDARIYAICCGDDEEYPEIREGEFVPYRFDWEIDQIQVE